MRNVLPVGIAACAALAAFVIALAVGDACAYALVSVLGAARPDAGHQAITMAPSDGPGR